MQNTLPGRDQAYTEHKQDPHLPAHPNWTRIVGLLGFCVALIFWGYIVSAEETPPGELIAAVLCLHLVSSMAWLGDPQ